MMFLVHFLCIIWLLPIIYLHGVAAQKSLQFDDGYVVEGVIYRVLDGIRIPFKAWYDSNKKQSRIDYNNGGAKTYQLPGNRTSTYYKITAAHSSTKNDYRSEQCFKIDANQLQFQPVLPDPSKFTFARQETFNNMQCNLYTYNSASSNESIVTSEKLWIRFEKEGVLPVRYDVKKYHYGIKPDFPDHYYLLDHYYLDYSYYMEDSCIDNEKFKIEPTIIKTCIVDLLNAVNPMHRYIPSKGVAGDANEWQKFYQRETEYRKEVFRKNLRYIDSVNRAGLSYKLGVNKFSDRTEEELKAMFGQESTEYNLSGATDCTETTDDWPDNNVPDRFDWRKYGAVSPVRNAIDCFHAESYFSVVDSVEGAYFIHNKMRKFVRLSPQAVMDCSWGQLNRGCNYARRDNSLKWIQEMKGIPLDEDYRPYTGIEGFCDVNKNVTKLVAPIKEICQVSKNATAFRKALYKHGPINVLFLVNSQAFSFYSSGLYDCITPATNKYVDGLIIGYGSFKGNPYWLLKFHYGSDWGMGGYAMISAAANDPCDVLSYSLYVTVSNNS